MDPAEARRRFAAVRVARLGTAGRDGRPHLVPVTFALVDDGADGVVVFAVDHKPKTTMALRRLHNIAASPLVTFLADEYSDDWNALWWARADAVGELLTPPTDDPRREAALDALAVRYPQYAAARPAGAVVWSTVTRWSGWQATEAG